jgi:FkbM family methyltransferase
MFGSVVRGGLVFDLGANDGDLTEMFLELGCEVVAVEPTPALAELIRRRFRIPVEACAIGAEEGEATLALGRDGAHSSIAGAWIAKTDRWAGSVTVPVRTLDSLIDQYGVPAFVKIDVEGGEPQVLAGLSQPVNLSFEFLSDLPDATASCVARLAELGEYVFQIELDDYELSPAVESSVLLEQLSRFPGGQSFDIFATRVDR